MNHYQLLGVTHTASLAEIKAAFKRRALQYHPDRNFGDKDAEEMFKQVNEAYKTLSKLGLRKRYDEKLGLNRAANQVNYQYHEGGFYRSTMNNIPAQPKNYPKPQPFRTQKRDIDFYLFWVTLGMIFILVSVFVCKM